MKNRKGIRALKKYLFGKPTAEEKAVIDKWYDEVEDSEIKKSDELPQIKEQLFIRTWDRLRLGQKIVPFYKSSFFKVAASVILILSAGLLIYILTSKDAQHQLTIAEVATPKLKQDVAAPDISKATITLADGSTLVLDSAGVGALVQQGNTRITKLANGEIVYNGGSQIGGEIQFNTLRVPRGSKPMQLVLADGSRAWINVASSITYPTAFHGAERSVKITGEVYFEVAPLSMPDKKNGVINVNKKVPFIVSAPSRSGDGRDLTIRVLGTHFNVNAYDDERSLKVTLLEGSVLVENAGTESLYLKPDQQAELSKKGKLSFHKDIDIDEVMAWKNNWFIFNSLTVPEIMRQIEKWYNVTISYDHPASDKHFSGIVSRNNNVSEALKIMEQAGIKFKIEGKNITVM